MDYNINTCVTNPDQKESQETFVLRSSDIKFFKKRNKTVCEMVFFDLSLALCGLHRFFEEN